jgi:hypothetical protein
MKLSRIIIAAALAIPIASSAFALDVKKTITVSASPAAAWKAVGTFCEVGDWLLAVTKCELSKKDGAVFRTLTLNNGVIIVEKQISRDDAKFRYSYAFVEGPLPLQNYVSTISVGHAAGHTTVTWTARFNAKGTTDDAAKALVDGAYETALAELKRKLTP